MLWLALHASTVSAQISPLWGGLEPGPHAVGFDAYWIADPARTYQRPRIDAEPSPRPILVNVWYPAAAAGGAPMPHGEYLAIARDAPAGSLAPDLAAYEREVIAAEMLGDAPEALNDADRGRLNAFLRTPTAAVRQAARSPGPHSLVLYHSGYGSSFEDNAVLCEYLASHGYLVVGSAFLSADGESFNIDAEADSAGDLEQLIREACSSWQADRSRIALIGHSGGAHTGFRFIARPTGAVRAFVSLDTTQDYHSFADHRWDDFVPLVLGRADDIDIPILMAARQHAMFRLADRLDRSRRVYLTFRDLEHNDFISQGVLGAEVRGAPEAPDLRAGHEELCRAILLFLDAELRGSAPARERLGALWEGAELGASRFVAEHAGAGAAGPHAYDPRAGRPPTPRQVAAAIDAGDVGVLTDSLRDDADDPRAAPLREVELAISVVFQLAHEGRADEARRVLASCGSAQTEVLRLLGAMRDMYRRVGADGAAEGFDHVLRVLGPDVAAPTP